MATTTTTGRRQQMGLAAGEEGDLFAWPVGIIKKVTLCSRCAENFFLPCCHQQQQQEQKAEGGGRGRLSHTIGCQMAKRLPVNQQVGSLICVCVCVCVCGVMQNVCKYFAAYPQAYVCGLST